MNPIEIQEKIWLLLKNIAPDTDPKTLKPQDNIKSCLGLDSFDALQFIVSLDSELGIDIPEQDYGQTDTMEHLLNYIGSRIK